MSTVGTTYFKNHAFELLPSEGIGFIRLGDSLYRLMKLLEKEGLHSDIRFIYSAESKTTVLQLVKLAINLVFDSLSQKLVLIEVNELAKIYGVSYGYKKDSISSFEFKHIYNKIFGPTYPGFLETATNSYYLSYPGIAFKFDGLCDLPELSANEDLNQVLNSSNSEKFASSLTIFRGNSWTEFSETLGTFLKDDNLFEKFDDFQTTFGRTTPGDIQLSRCEIYLPARLLTFNFSSHPLRYQFHMFLGRTSMQDVIACLGPPEDTVSQVKEPGLSSQSKERELFKIHNYFKYGFDLIYKLEATNAEGANVVEQITIHRNVVNSLDFLKYETLNFLLFGYNIYEPACFQQIMEDTDSCVELDSNDMESAVPSHYNFDTIRTSLGLDPDSKPIFLNRKEYELSPHHNNSNGAFEVIDYEDHFSSDSPPISSDSKSMLHSNCTEKTAPEDNEEFKNWGLTKLFGYGRCVFEVLIDGDHISSITLV